MKKPLPSPELLCKFLRYEPDTGKLFWRKRTPSVFATGGPGSGGHCKRWNTCFSGNEAFSVDGGRGYLIGRLGGRNHLAHRIIWAMVHGEWPLDQIDHINGVRDDNRLINLRCVNNSENHKNMKIRSDNTSGTVGVYWIEVTGKWRATITVGGKNKQLGYFYAKEDAIASRKSAEAKYGYHKNHGR